METAQAVDAVKRSVPGGIRRAGRFYLVGAAGFAVQLGALWVFRGVWGIPYLWATLFAVEAALLHNFAWHEHWTWAGRWSGGWAARLIRFHLANGAVSLVGNLLLMRLLAGAMGVHYLAANVLSIVACALANFFLAEWFVFRGPAKGTAASP